MYKSLYADHWPRQVATPTGHSNKVLLETTFDHAQWVAEL